MGKRKKVESKIKNICVSYEDGTFDIYENIDNLFMAVGVGEGITFHNMANDNALNVCAFAKAVRKQATNNEDNVVENFFQQIFSRMLGDDE